MSEMEADKLDFYSMSPLMDCKFLITRQFVFLSRCLKWLVMRSDFSAPKKSLHLEKLDGVRGKIQTERQRDKRASAAEKQGLTRKKRAPLCKPEGGGIDEWRRREGRASSAGFFLRSEGRASTLILTHTHTHTLGTVDSSSKGVKVAAVLLQMSYLRP